MVGTPNKIITWLLEQNNEKQYELKEYRPKRSLNANAYCWILCDKIAKEMNKDNGDIYIKEDVYKDAITQIGTFEPMIVQERTFQTFKRIWENQGVGFIVQEIHRQDNCVKVHCYYGSSTYDTKEMSLLIQLLVNLAESLNIETKPQQEIDSLLRSWNQK